MYDWLDEYLLSKKGASWDFKAEWGWRRYLIGDKMFAAVCTPDVKYKPYNGRTLLQLKCEPSAAEILRQSYNDIVPGFYSDKRNWNSIYLDGTVPDEVMKRMCDRSYELVLAGFSKKKQLELLGR
ncbi:MAG: MmcQ/YjbR family DNA-binding protein [Clostridia bacterium]